MLTLVLTRHGTTVRSEPEQHLGQRIDIELSAEGRQQAAALAGRLSGVAFERIISSPLLRARQTAETVAGSGARIEIEQRLIEMDYGEWEGLTYEEIRGRDASARAVWEADPAGLACPGGESGNEVAARVRSWLEELVGSAGDGDEADHRILAVGHSTTNRILLCVSLGVAVRDYRRRFKQAPANLTVLRFPGPPGSGASLLVGNDVCHLRGTEGPSWD